MSQYDWQRLGLSGAGRLFLDEEDALLRRLLHLQESRSASSAGATGPGCPAAIVRPHAGGFLSAGGRDWHCKDASLPALCFSFSWLLSQSCS